MHSLDWWYHMKSEICISHLKKIIYKMAAILFRPHCVKNHLLVEWTECPDWTMCRWRWGRPGEDCGGSNLLRKRENCLFNLKFTLQKYKSCHCYVRWFSVSAGVGNTKVECMIEGTALWKQCCMKCLREVAAHKYYHTLYVQHEGRYCKQFADVWCLKAALWF